ncbi:hypothetical protein EK21DRAFT_92819 [Setomelanomma holmii]|uniref:Uncharacterized protein n=1 Tax=Setomelanomma holmii TaxID=210430 RepID=A0A9P4H233_9PLEO|nr:hypothetical protein EK21DRAFT_92819 [Setomelanomma holmii]
MKLTFILTGLVALAAAGLPECNKHNSGAKQCKNGIATFWKHTPDKVMKCVGAKGKWEPTGEECKMCMQKSYWKAWCDVPWKTAVVADVIVNGTEVEVQGKGEGNKTVAVEFSG